MKKDELKRQYNVDADKINWHYRSDVLMRSRAIKDHSVMWTPDFGYQVVDEYTNSISQWRCDLSALEEI